MQKLFANTLNQVTPQQCTSIANCCDTSKHDDNHLISSHNILLISNQFYDNMLRSRCKVNTVIPLLYGMILDCKAV